MPPPPNPPRDPFGPDPGIPWQRGTTRNSPASLARRLAAEGFGRRYIRDYLDANWGHYPAGTRAQILENAMIWGRRTEGFSNRRTDAVIPRDWMNLITGQGVAYRYEVMFRVATGDPDNPFDYRSVVVNSNRNLTRAELADRALEQWALVDTDPLRRLGIDRNTPMRVILATRAS